MQRKVVGFWITKPIPAILQKQATKYQGSPHQTSLLSRLATAITASSTAPLSLPTTSSKLDLYDAWKSNWTLQDR